MNYIKNFFAHNKIRSLLLFLLSITLCVSLVSYSPSDPSFNVVTNDLPTNLLFYFGSYASDLLYQLFGIGAFILPLCMISWSYKLYNNEKLNYGILYFFLILTIGFGCSALIDLKINLLPSGSGGILGIAINYLMNHLFTSFDQLVIYKKFIYIGYIILSIIFGILAIGIPLKAYAKIIFGFFKGIIFAVNKTGLIQKIGSKLSSFDKGNAYYAEGEFGSINRDYNNIVVSAPKNNAPNSALSNPTNNATNSIPNNSPSYKNNITKPVYETAIDKNILPSINLLDEIDNQNFKAQTQAELAETSDRLMNVLQDFGVKGRILDAREGPVVTMYEFEPAAGTKSSRVIGLADDISRSLCALSARIAVIPGRNAIGIELPNKNRQFFRIRELVQTQEFQDPNISLPLILGKDLTGRPLIADLAKMPHLLVAGTTGSGKSVAINAMILSLLYRYTPDECKMIMIDPKMLELSAYDNIPHLMTPVVTESSKAIVALKWAVKEMENRYRLMSHLGVRNITNYNTKLQESVKEGKNLDRQIQTGFDPETGRPIYETVPIDMKKMPFIVVIVDEMADLMIVAGKDIESSIQRLAQMARAAGIHIIMATQRPSVDVITGVIKANFPSRISFKVTSKIDSRTILGEQGAEQLLGMGDMLFMGNSSKILRVHGPFVDDKEVEKVTNFLRQTGSPDYIAAVTESEEAEEFGDKFSDTDASDLYAQAVNIVRIERKSSISYIQRCLRIGYNRAANLVEEMEKNGVLSSPNHSGKREILLPED